jgi:hypothetical protein
MCIYIFIYTKQYNFVTIGLAKGLTTQEVAEGGGLMTIPEHYAGEREQLV